MKDYEIFLMDYSIHDYVVYTVVTYIYLSPIHWPLFRAAYNYWRQGCRTARAEWSTGTHPNLLRIFKNMQQGRFRWRIMKFFWWITRFTIMLCTQLSRTFICRPFIGRCFVRLTTTDDKDIGRLRRSDPLERTQIYCAYSKTCSTIWLIMEQWVSNTDQQLTAYHMYPLNKRLEKIHIYPMRGYSVFWW